MDIFGPLGKTISSEEEGSFFEEGWKPLIFF